MKNKVLMMVAGLMVLMSVLSACGSSDQTGFPTGKFVKPDNEQYGLIFNEDGTFSVFSSKDVTLVTGTYSVDGDLFIEESNNGGCVSPMSFKYSFDGSNLNFQYVGDPADDTCEGRRADFNNQTYILSK